MATAAAIPSKHGIGLPLQKDILKEGYLSKQGEGAFRKWQRRYFLLKPTGISYYELAPDQVTS
jgi:hypothetical protein